MSYQRDAGMEDAIFASSPILEACHASMQVPAIGFILRLLHKAGHRCVSPLALRIRSSLRHPTLTASQTFRPPCSSSPWCSSLLCSCFPAIGFGRGMGSQGHKEGKACETRARAHIDINAWPHCLQLFWKERKDGRNEYGSRSRRIRIHGFFLEARTSRPDASFCTGCALDERIAVP